MPSKTNDASSTFSWYSLGEPAQPAPKGGLVAEIISEFCTGVRPQLVTLVSSPFLRSSDNYSILHW